MNKTSAQILRKTSKSAQILRNLKFITSAICDQALQLRNDPDAFIRLRTIAGELERVTDKIGGTDHG